MANLVDLGTALTDDGADHIVWNVDLLSDGLTRHRAHGLWMLLTLGTRASSLLRGRIVLSLLRARATAVAGLSR